MAGSGRRQRRGAVALAAAAGLLAAPLCAFVPVPGTAAQAAAREGRRPALLGAAVLPAVGSAVGAVSAAEADFDVELKVSLGGDKGGEATFVVKVHPEWAPVGAAQFKKLVESGWYDQAGVFRVVEGFVAQFGLPAKAQPRLQEIKDDPVKVSNKRGTLVFATRGPNTRTSQLFINYKDNSFLDKQGFSPFAEVVGDGMQVVDKFYAGYGQKPNQGAITEQGNQYLDKEFPKLTKISKATVKG